MVEQVGPLLFKRGNSAKVAVNTPALGEPLYNTQTKELKVGDGATAAGATLSITHTPAGNGAIKTTVESRLRRLTINVDDFGAVGNGTTDDLAAFTLAANYAQSLANGTNRTPPIEVPNRQYFLSGNTPVGTWWLGPGSDIMGLPGVSPSFQTDTSRLLGTVFRFSGVDQYSTLFVGDPRYTNQKNTGRVLAAQVMGASNRAAGGVSGFTYTSGRDGADQASIGVAAQAYNDNVNTPKTAWAFYGESIRTLAGTGNAFAAELSSFNYAPVISSNPYQQPGETTGVTVGMWLSALGDVDSTAAIGVITAGRKWQKGFVFYQNSLVSGEAVAMPYGYQMGWYLSGTSGMASYVKSDILQQYAVDGPCYTRGVRGGATTVNNSLIKLDNWSGNNAGTEVVLASARLYQTSAFSGGFATSRLDWSAKTAAGADNFMSLDSTAVFPLTSSGLSSGTASNRWSSVAGVNADFTGKAKFSGLGNYATDAAAATGGVAIGELYHNAGAVRVRLT